MAKVDTIRIAGVVGDSIVDGPGLRLTVFVQGCPHNCEGCHNPETHDFAGGIEFDLQDFIARVRDEIIHNPILSGVTFSGGEPMCQPEALLEVAKAVRELEKNIVIYTGYTYEQLLERKEPEVRELLSMAMLLVDGPFILAQRNLEIKFRGSTNQRLIDPQKSLEQGKIVEWKSKFDI